MAEQKMEEIFNEFDFPYRERIDSVKDNRKMFAHYTNVNAVMQILKNQELWMRST